MLTVLVDNQLLLLRVHGLEHEGGSLSKTRNVLVNEVRRSRKKYYSRKGER